METIFKWIFQAFLDWAYKKYGKQKLQDALNKKFEDDLNSNSDEAIADVRAPLDPRKTVEEREKDAEAAFDRYHDKLN